MLNAEVIEPATLRLVVLMKKKGGCLKFYVGYRVLSAVTKKDSYPLPHINVLSDELGPMDIVTIVRARTTIGELNWRQKTDGYHLFLFCRLPFVFFHSLCNVSETNTQCSASVLGRHTLTYLDDVFIYSRGFAQHLEHLGDTLQLLFFCWTEA